MGKYNGQASNADLDYVPKIIRKDGTPLLHVITADEASKWGGCYEAGDSLLEINDETPSCIIEWLNKNKTLHVESWGTSRNEVTIYAENSQLCIDSTFEIIGDFIEPDDESKKVYSIQDNVLVCGEIRSQE